MIELHFWPTPNGYKISIFLEEAGLPYEIVPVNIGRGDQFKPEFLAIAPNNRMPAIVDKEPKGGGAPISVFESAAILQYLGDKTGAFYPQDLRARTVVNEWLAWQIAHVGPTFGQLGHFKNYASEKIPYAIDRFMNEAHRIFGVLDKRLDGRDYLAGDYSIADMANWPWFKVYESYGLEIAGEFPRAQAWIDRIAARPAVQKGLETGAALKSAKPMDDEAKRLLFNQRARK